MIILYSNSCSRCGILKKKIQDKHITFQECNDEEEFAKRGFRSLPMLEVNGDVLDFSKAVQYVNTL